MYTHYSNPEMSNAATGRRTAEELMQVHLGTIGLERIHMTV
ncbi:MAG: hypothetical protein ACLU80_16880 [Dorea sp.]